MLAKMVKLWNSYELAQVEDSIPEYLLYTLTELRLNMLPELLEAQPKAYLQECLALAGWVNSLPEDVKTWIIEYTGEFPGRITYLPARAFIKTPDGGYRIDPAYKDPKAKAPKLKELFGWYTGVLTQFILLRRGYQIIVDLAEHGEAQPSAGWDISGGFKPDPKGKLRYVPSEQEKCLQAIFDGVEAARIKRCVVCNQFFWAGRLDQSACSPKCASIHRIRTYRSKHPIKKGDNQSEDD